MDIFVPRTEVTDRQGSIGAPIVQGTVNLARSRRSWCRHSHHASPSQPTKATPVTSRQESKAPSRAARYSLAERR